jgi:hypothetical protein
MISSNRIDPVIHEHILSQHRELHARLMAVRLAFAETCAPDRPRLQGMREGLADLRDHLRRHFEQEECGGFMEESIARMPRLAAAARQVVGEHPRLLAELDGLLESLAVRDIRPESWQEAGRGFAAFAEHLLAHERNENAVVQDGYNEDFGLE